MVSTPSGSNGAMLPSSRRRTRKCSASAPTIITKPSRASSELMRRSAVLGQ